MKAILLNGINDLQITELPAPRPGPGEVLLRTSSVGICGSDVHHYKEGGTGGAILESPFILGHEFSAYIETGENKGHLASVDPALPCGECEYCLEGNPNFCLNLSFAGAEGIDGGLREYITWPEKAVFPLPKQFTPEEGALLEPLGIAIHALHLGKVFPGMDVGIFGAGPVGLLAIQMAKAAGAARIFSTDKLSHRLEHAKVCGATDIYLADGSEAGKIDRATQSRGLDVVFEAAGDDGSAVETAVETAKRGAAVIVIGIPSNDETRFTASISRRKGLTFKIVRRMKNTYPTAIKLVTSGIVNLKSLITHRFSLQEYHEAFETAAKREGIKVFINF